MSINAATKSKDGERDARRTVQPPEAAPRAAVLPRIQPILSIEDVSLGYKTRGEVHTPVRNINLELAKNEQTVIIGPSGCGKSTLLKAVAGFIQPLTGRITVDGHEAPQPGPDRAVVFQEQDQLFPWMTTANNVAYGLRVKGASRRAAIEAARHHLSVVNLEGAADLYPHQLSGGMKQRAAIARALALEPQLLLMDEPFGALDAITRRRLQDELRDLLRRTTATLLFVTHSIEEAIILADTIVVMASAEPSLRQIIDLTTLDSSDARSADCLQVADELHSLLGECGR